MEHKKHLDLVTSLCTGLIGLYSLLESQTINEQYYARPQHSDFLTSPALMPMILGIALILFSLILLTRSLRGTSIAQLCRQLAESCRSFVTSSLVHRTLLGLLLMGIYVYGLLRTIPFLISSFVFLVILMLMLRTTKLWKILVISAVASLAIVLLFTGVFHIRLP